MVEIPATVILNNVEIEAGAEVYTPEITTDDYSALANKPSINGVVLIGDKSSHDLHLADLDDLYNYYPTDTASGAVASFSDGAEDVPVKALSVSIEPVQSGTGDPSPSNVRPISGHTQAVVWDDPVHGGAVKWNQLIQNGDFSDGTTNWSGQGMSASASNGVLTIVPLAAGGTRGVNYTFSVDLPADHKYIVEFYETPSKAARALVRCIASNGTTYFDVDFKDLSANTRTRYSRMFSATNSVHQMRILPVAAGQPATTDTYKIEKVVVYDLTQMLGAPVADEVYALERATQGSGIAWFENLFPKDYYAYNAGELKCVSEVNDGTYRKAVVDLDGTRYGGTLDVTTGVLTVTHRAEVFDGTEVWTKSSAYAGSFWRDTGNTHATAYNNRAIICSHLVNVFMGSTTYVGGTIAFDGTNKRNINVFFPQFDASTTVDQFKEYLAAQKTAGTPFTVLSLMDEPITVQLTPTEVTTLLGDNNIFCSTGDTEATYRADMGLFIRKLIGGG